MKSEKEKKVIEASMGLFLRHGFQKVTMSDIAEAVGVSRPTLYQCFPNKEEIFKSLIENWAKDTIAVIEKERDPKAPAKKQLQEAINLWTIEPFKMMLESSETSELQDCAFGFAKDIVDKSYQGFEKIIIDILKTSDRSNKVSSKELANLISVSLRGFKSNARDVKELQKLVNNLIEVALN